MQGDQLVALARTRIVDTYILGSLVPKNNSKYHGPWDCAELGTWLVYQISQKLYGCAKDNGNPNSADAYTGFWKRDADDLGQIISVKEAAVIPGAFLLRYSGSGLIGHLALSVGTGNSTIEAHSRADGTIESVINGRRWDIGVLIPWITYTPSQPAPIIEPPKGTILRFTTPLMKGDMVRRVQMVLFGLGYSLDIDGIYGSHTYYAVKTFQGVRGLVADGEVGPKTAQALKIDWE